MTSTIVLATAALLAADAAGTDRARPRFAAGGSLAITHVMGGSGEHDEALAFGLTAAWRPHRFLAVAARYSHAPVDHQYGQLQFSSAYHRVVLAPEGRLPLGERFDFAGWIGPELVVLRSALTAAPGGERTSGRSSVGVALGGGVAYRVWRVELRADAALGLRAGRQDRAFIANVLWTWP